MERLKSETDVVVIGAGITGLCVAHLLSRLENIDVVLLEKQRSPGGMLRTFSKDGFICESTASGWYETIGEVLEVVEKLGLGDRVVKGRVSPLRRVIYRKHRLHPFPGDHRQFMSCGAVPLAGRIRGALEPLIKRRITVDDESVADFAKRRLGASAGDALINSEARYLYGGNPERLSVNSCFRWLSALERSKEPIIDNLILRSRAARIVGRESSLLNGMTELAEKLGHSLKGRLVTACPVCRVGRTAGDGFATTCDGDSVIESKVVVSAVPSFEAAALLTGLDRRLSEQLSGIEYAPLAVGYLGYHERQMPAELEGAGVLIPARANLSVLGVGWPSSVYRGRAPAGHHLLRATLGGTLSPELLERDDTELTDIIRRDLQEVMGIPFLATPSLKLVIRHDKAVPQFNVGYEGTAQSIAMAEMKHPGLFIGGSGLAGIDLDGCIGNARMVADRAYRYLKTISPD